MECTYEKLPLLSQSLNGLTQAPSSCHDLGLVLLHEEHHFQVKVEIHPHKGEDMWGLAFIGHGGHRDAPAAGTFDEPPLWSGYLPANCLGTGIGTTIPVEEILNYTHLVKSKGAVWMQKGRARIEKPCPGMPVLGISWRLDGSISESKRR